MFGTRLPPKADSIPLPLFSTSGGMPKGSFAGEKEEHLPGLTQEEGELLAASPEMKGLKKRRRRRKKKPIQQETPLLSPVAVEEVADSAADVPEEMVEDNGFLSQVKRGLTDPGEWLAAAKRTGVGKTASDLLSGAELPGRLVREGISSHLNKRDADYMGAGAGEGDAGSVDEYIAALRNKNNPALSAGMGALDEVAGAAMGPLSAIDNRYFDGRGAQSLANMTATAATDPLTALIPAMRGLGAVDDAVRGAKRLGAGAVAAKPPPRLRLTAGDKSFGDGGLTEAFDPSATQPFSYGKPPRKASALSSLDDAPPLEETPSMPGEPMYKWEERQAAASALQPSRTVRARPVAQVAPPPVEEAAPLVAPDNPWAKGDLRGARWSPPADTDISPAAPYSEAFALEPTHPSRGQEMLPGLENIATPQIIGAPPPQMPRMGLQQGAQGQGLGGMSSSRFNLLNDKERLSLALGEPPMPQGALSGMHNANPPQFGQMPGPSRRKPLPPPARYSYWDMLK